MTNVKSLLEMYVKMGGSLTDTYSDIAGGVPVGQYSTISDAILACSKKYSAGGGGGAEKFIVNIRDNSGVTSDKTIAEIVAAKEAGKDVVANVYIGIFNVTAEIPLIYAFEVQGQGAAVVFSAPVPSMGEGIGENIYTVYGLVATGSDDAWNSDRVSVGGSSNAPLIVTLEFDDPQEPTAFVGDKTYGEVFTAVSAGTPCTLVLSADGANVATPVLSATSSSGTIVLYTYDTDSSSIKSIQGSGSDYVTIAIS